MGETTLFCLGGPLHAQLRTANHETFDFVHARWPWRRARYRLTVLATPLGAQRFWVHEYLAADDAAACAMRVIAASAPID